MGSSPTGLCRSLLLIALSSIPLDTAATYDYSSRPKAAFDFEDSVSQRFENRVEKLPRGGSNNLSDPALYSRPACRNQDGLEGVCHINQLGCKLRGGAVSHVCEGNNGVCCIFQHTCSEFTEERLSYYRNPDFPFPNNGNLICNYKVLIQPEVCALRIDILNYTTPITSICSEVQLSFLVGNHTRTVPICGVLTGNTVLLDKLNATRDKEVVISHVLGGKEPYRFELRVAQILCSTIKPLPVEGACGRRNIGMVRHKRSEEPMPDDKWHTSLDPDQEDDFDSGDQISLRIIGGEKAKVNEWPWQVALLKKIITKRGPRAQYFCGATLINKEYILTAAHCFSRIRDFNHTDVRKRVVAFIGDHDLRTRAESQQVFRRLKRIIIHPLYDWSRNQNDIALLQLSKPVNYTGAVAPACLPSFSRNFTGKDINISGWGTTYFNGTTKGPFSPILKTTTVKGVSREECDAKWEKFDSKNTVFRDLPHIHEKQGCITNTPGNACFGDSGGPATFKEANGRFTVIGVVSFGYPTCEVGGHFPTIYTRVSSFMDWITAAMVDVF